MLTSEGISVTPKIFGKLHEAGIVQLFEDWPHMVTPRRQNITRKVHTLVEKRQRESVTKISLTGNIQAIFYIYLVSILISCVEMLTGEISICVNLRRCLHVARQWFRAMWKYRSWPKHIS